MEVAGSCFFAIGLADAFLMLKLPFESETGQIHRPEVNMAKSNKSQKEVVSKPSCFQGQTVKTSRARRHIWDTLRHFIFVLDGQKGSFFPFGKLQ